MKTIMEMFKTRNPKIVLYLGALLAVGACLMLVGRLPGGQTAGTGGLLPGTDNTANHAADPSGGVSTSASATNSAVGATDPHEGYRQERALELRLEEIFSLVEGAGRARVMLRLKPTRETVYAADSNTSESVTKEQDAQGGSRETESTTRQDKTILITDGSGEEHPLVLREIEPGIAGVIIIAEGGDSVFVQDALTKAACTVLGIEANKVQILKMRGD